MGDYQSIPKGRTFNIHLLVAKIFKQFSQFNQVIHILLKRLFYGVVNYKRTCQLLRIHETSVFHCISLSVTIVDFNFK